MGKRYYCDYCDKTMSSATSTIKTHNQGLLHQKLLNEHYQQFKDPETILQEESNKKPCLRFSKGECQFGSICHYSHYTREQLQWLSNYVASKKQEANQVNQPSFTNLYSQLQSQKHNTPAKDNEILYDSNGVTHVLPWTYNTEFDSENLPPSLKRLKLEDFYEASFVDWG